MDDVFLPGPIAQAGKRLNEQRCFN